MSSIAVITHRASIAGYVSDAVCGARIAGAAVEIPAVGLKTQTRADGFYFFIDLADGSYALRATAPLLGTRYGTVSVSGVVVASDSAGRPLFDPKGNLALPPTRLSGVVRRSDTLAPLAHADITLRASLVSVKSTKTGQYAFVAAEAGTQTVQVAVPGFTTLIQAVTLGAGLDTTVDFNLTPA